MTRGRAAVAVALCWAAFVGIGWQIAHRQSCTSDEVAHIGAGVGYLQGDLRLNREHPPLVKLLAAAALRLHTLPRVPAQVDRTTQWIFGHTLLHSGKPGRALVLLGRARTPVVLLTSLGLLLVALFAYLLEGPLAASAAAFFAACCPLWYAHGTLVTTDAAISVFTLGAALCAQRLMHSGASPRQTALWSPLLVLSVALGFASKYSMPVSVAGLGLAALIAATPTRNWRALLSTWAALLLGSLVGSAFAWGWPPDVAAYVAGVHHVGFNHKPDYLYYAFGQFFMGVGSQPLYLARALLVKLEWPLLLCSTFGLLRIGSRALHDAPASDERTAAITQLAFLAIVPGVYLATMSWFAPALGVRYALPVVPFAFVAAGCGVAQLVRLRWGRIAVVAAAGLELLALSQALQTSPIAWFNGFPCRTGDIPACLDDSNLDWGQALPALAQYRDAHFPGQSLRVFQFIQVPLPAYLRRARDAAPIECMSPYRAIYAASLHALLRMPAESAFTRAKPQAIVGGSFAIFDLRAVDVLPPAPR